MREYKAEGVVMREVWKHARSGRELRVVKKGKRKKATVTKKFWKNWRIKIGKEKHDIEKVATPHQVRQGDLDCYNRARRPSGGRLKGGAWIFFGKCYVSHKTRYVDVFEIKTIEEVKK